MSEQPRGGGKLMIKMIVVGLAGLFGGVALAVIAMDKVPSGATFSTSNEGGPSESIYGIESRLLALEEALAAEQRARQLLEEQLFSLIDTAIEISDAAVDSVQQTGVESGVSRWEGRYSRRSESREVRAERLVEAGFDEATADWILTRESESQMEALRRRYEARRSIEIVSFQQTDPLRSQLIEQLGDAGYEQYLVANGRSLHVSVGSVLDSSPAQSAGLRPGDQIVSYGGARVFNMYELTQEIMQGVPDDRVVVEFLRDGVPMQVVLPRGPVGITGR
jgi:membrane-associated protease RseP (regulator of RpoE activity)